MSVRAIASNAGNSRRDRLAYIVNRGPLQISVLIPLADGTHYLRLDDPACQAVYAHGSSSRYPWARAGRLRLPETTLSTSACR